MDGEQLESAVTKTAPEFRRGFSWEKESGLFTEDFVHTGAAD